MKSSCCWKSKKSLWSEIEILEHEVGDKSTAPFRIKRGKYKDVKVRISCVSIEDKGDQAMLNYHFEVLEDEPRKSKLEKSDKFQRFVGNILMDALNAAIADQELNIVGASHEV